MPPPMKMTQVKPFYVCDPSDDRCVRPVEAHMMPGISVRHSPSCTGNVCNLFACDGGNWRVTNQGTLDRAEWIKGWAITQLFTRAFVDCQEHPLSERGGGWWVTPIAPAVLASNSKADRSCGRCNGGTVARPTNC
jgi:hypothetical protein